MNIPNKIHLTTYANSFGKNFNELNTVLDKYFKGAVEGVHVLPYYPSSGDRGFSPLCHKEVDPQFGNWDDVGSLAKDHVLMSDLIVNHISSQSEFFQDYLKNGDRSEYADYFITARKFSRRVFPKREKTGKLLDLVEDGTNYLRKMDRFFHHNGVNKVTVKKIYRPRQETPLVPYELADGTKTYLWCTFTKDQIDLDVNSPDVRELFVDIIDHLAKYGTKILRLDAVGYAVKKRDTNSFMLLETFELIQWLAEQAHKRGVAVLPEIHNHYKIQLALAQTDGVDYVYDFVSSVLILHSIYTKDGEYLKNWIDIRPTNVITNIDAHDGLPIVDLEDLMPEDKIDEIVELIKEKGGNELRRASGISAENVDTYQVNCTYYSALSEEDDAYIVARAIQFFIPGIPQIYHVGLLAGKNDVEKFKRTNIGRDVLRHNYTVEEIERETQREVVKRLLKMMRFRNSHKAFDGEFTLHNSPKDKLMMVWQNDDHFCRIEINLNDKTAIAIYSDERTKKMEETKF